MKFKFISYRIFIVNFLKNLLSSISIFTINFVNIFTQYFLLHESYCHYLAIFYKN